MPTSWNTEFNSNQIACRPDGRLGDWTAETAAAALNTARGAVSRLKVAGRNLRIKRYLSSKKFPNVMQFLTIIVRTRTSVLGGTIAIAVALGAIGAAALGQSRWNLGGMAF